MVRIVTDSTCDLPADIIKHYHIEVVPLQVLFGREVFYDRVDISPQDFFRRLATAEALPTTSQPSAGDFLKVFQRILNAGDEILGIFISSKLSGTLASSIAAREQLADQPITTIDSLSVSFGLGFLVIEAARALEAGASRQEAAAHVTALREHVQIFFLVDTLEYLHKGGRIGGAQVLLGTLFRFKPILTLVDGIVEPFEKVRTRKRSLLRLVEVMAEQAGTKVTGIAVLHGAAEAEARQVERMVKQTIQAEQYFFTDITPVIGVHTGPGLIGIAAYTHP